MAGGDEKGKDLNIEELKAIVRGIRERVRAEHPASEADAAGVILADLMPLVHARDAAEAKVAAIGTVNPRPPGLLNNLIQAVKRLVARALDWHVREQVEFNRAMVEAVNRNLDALNEINRSLERLAERLAALRSDELAELRRMHEELRRHVTEALEGPVMQELREQKDIRTHWQEWRKGWEEKLATNEIQFLRGLADLRAAYDHRVSQIEANFRDLVRSQHSDFETALERASLEIQKKMWDDFERIRAEYERLIHNELRLLRQRASLSPPAQSAGPAGQSPPAGGERPQIDYLKFAERFRGSEEEVKRRQEFYLERFRGCTAVLDLGCGRGEFLELMKEAGIPARGVDADPECVALCREKGLKAEQQDLLAYLAGVEAESCDGIFCSHVIEHLPPAQAPELIRRAAAALRRGGLLAIETPNPACLAAMAVHFYMDPTHERPVPSQLLAFYLEEAGFGRIEVHELSPAIETISGVGELPEKFRESFFGGLDYAILARRL